MPDYEHFLKRDVPSNTEQCGYHGGNCTELYPNFGVLYPSLIGDGCCDSGNYNIIEELNLMICVVSNRKDNNPTYIGNGYSNG